MGNYDGRGGKVGPRAGFGWQIGPQAPEVRRSLHPAENKLDFEKDRQLSKPFLRKWQVAFGG